MADMSERNFQEFEFISVKQEPLAEEVVPNQEFLHISVKQEPYDEEVLPNQEFMHISVKQEPYDEEVLPNQVAINNPTEDEYMADPLLAEENVSAHYTSDGASKTDCSLIKQEVAINNPTEDEYTAHLLFAEENDSTHNAFDAECKTDCSLFEEQVAINNPTGEEYISDPLPVKEKVLEFRGAEINDTWNLERTLNFQAALSRDVEQCVSFVDLENDSHVLRHHSRSMQGRVPVQTFTCDVCSEVFTSKYNITNHVFRHIDGVLPPSYMCILCGEVFFTAECLGEHLLLCQSKQNEAPGDKCMCETPGRKQCDYCQKSFVQSAHLDKPQHMFPEKHVYHLKLINIKETLYRCQVCGKCFIDATSLTRHERTHKRKRALNCEICNRYFISNSHMVVHKCAESGEKQFQCHLCDKRFVRMSHLTFHQHVHTGAKLLKCDTCDKTYALKVQLTQHQLNHNRKEPY